MKEIQNIKHNAKELAYLYDLYIVPQWCEAFDRIIDEEVKLPEDGKILDAGCGTGGYVVDLALRAGAKTEVVGIDGSEERLVLARGKVEVAKLNRATFRRGSLTALGVDTGEFDLVIGDASMVKSAEIGLVFGEFARVAKTGATLAAKLTTRGSFDEFFSIYWEALYNLNLVEYSAQLEGLITERLTVTDAEALAVSAGWKQVRSVTRKERFDYHDANTFIESPLIETTFLDDWFAILPDQRTRENVRDQIINIIDEERREMDFDVSIKATVVIGEK